MSTGIVICSVCKREAHQGQGTFDPFRVSTRWHHCEDGSNLCPGASVVYPSRREEIVGPVCGRDGDVEV